MTDRAKFQFTPKIGPDGSWIELERIDKNLNVLGNGFLGLDLPQGTTSQRALEIAEFLNNNITFVSYTSLP
jgi:hypothetical protein